ncbi:MAG: hypothetical protein AB8E15_12850 [Bdellovibrionales bacterium]
MRNLLIFGLLFASLSAFADAREVRVTSFYYVENGNQQNTAAEICGTVTGNVSLLDRITITTDYDYKPAAFTTLADQNGRFCAVVRTLRGTASVQLWQLANGDIAESKVEMKNFKK